MKFFDTDSFQEIWATITRNKFRSIATGFGVFWGLFMLIVLLALGNKIKYSIMGQLDGFEQNSVFFWPDRTSEAYKGYRKGRWWAFNNRDVDLIHQRAQSVDLVSPMLYGRGGDKNVVRGLKSGTYTFRGVYPQHFLIEPMNVLYGRLFNQVDIDERRKVCVIGKEVYETLFNEGENPIGAFIRISGIYFQVVGVISPKTNVSISGDGDEAVFLPFSTQQMMFDRSDDFWFLSCTAKDGYTAAQVESEVRGILGAAHTISPTDTKAIESLNLELQFQMVTGLFTGITVLMWIVGLGALFSGIIGISNIMLVTVRERMREIGVRRALGAKPFDIMGQIMSESFVLTAIAGLLGFLVGVGCSLLIGKFMVLDPDVIITKPIISFNLALSAMAVLVVCGVLAGLLPAWRALKIKAIDAIRDE
ncbi:MAG: ABC transporter permease [Rikenellaceae bacterium]|jgi:putative ABC transport system permease protein|nr:ABC transporter permease [Rikenellaceae bacterium]